MGVDAGARVMDTETRSIAIGGKHYTVSLHRFPFREGVELRCVIGNRRFAISDRGLGEHEAFRLLEEEIAQFLEEGPKNEI